MSEAPKEAAKVVSLHGDEIRPPYVPDPKLVAGIEDVLELARSGEINGVVIAISNSDHTTQSRRLGVMSRGLIGMLEVLKMRTCQDVG